MANSKYEYVKTFEKSETLLPSTYIVVRIDGRGFHKFSSKYGFEKPNDRRALDLMNAAATGVLKELPDICFAYGLSDEFR
ncbi:tRNA-histidine guanylyltransferase 1-like [Xylographa trunciseda]|nr:tRNA-histidine guanylyltransferase 1-like [Xylographa trunciseda]